MNVLLFFVCLPVLALLAAWLMVAVFAGALLHGGLADRLFFGLLALLVFNFLAGLVRRD